MHACHKTLKVSRAPSMQLIGCFCAEEVIPLQGYITRSVEVTAQEWQHLTQQDVTAVLASHNRPKLGWCQQAAAVCRACMCMTPCASCPDLEEACSEAASARRYRWRLQLTRFCTAVKVQSQSVPLWSAQYVMLYTAEQHLPDNTGSSGNPYAPPLSYVCEPERPGALQQSYFSLGG